MNTKKATGRAATLARVMSCVCLLLLTTTQFAWAFKPSNTSSGKNDSDETHQSITESAIKDAIQEFFGITILNNSMIKARDQIAKANAGVDLSTTFFAAKYHFDAESFDDGQSLVQGEFDAIVKALGNRNGPGARAKLGAALHTIQDFYAHSDWVELKPTFSMEVGRKGYSLKDLQARKRPVRAALRRLRAHPIAPTVSAMCRPPS